MNNSIVNIIHLTIKNSKNGKLFLDLENAAGKLRRPLNLLLVDMGFEAKFLGHKDTAVR